MLVLEPYVFEKIRYIQCTHASKRLQAASITDTEIHSSRSRIFRSHYHSTSASSAPIVFNMQTKHLLKLQNSKLRNILLSCGWPTSGTKATMADNIFRNMRNSWLAPSASALENAHVNANGLGVPQTCDYKILSIDMGIKNMALCCLNVPRRDIMSSTPAIPELTTWKRFSPLDARAAEMCSDEPATPSDFSAEALAPLAARIAQELLDKYCPTVIAIETQRYRTMGSASVQEWTIRVNRLEAMLHACFAILKNNRTGSRVPVLGISPQRTTNYWLADDIKLGRDTKKLKTNLVRSWVIDGTTVSFQHQSSSVAEAVSLFSGKNRLSKARAKGAGKVDDLADSLLQALALVRWEQNRLRFVNCWSRSDLVSFHRLDDHVEVHARSSTAR